MCFADVVRAEFGVGGQVLFTTRDGASSHLDLGMVPVVDRDPALAHVRSRLPPGSCADITPPVHRKDQLLHVAWNLMLWLASVGVELGYSFRQWTG